MHHCWHHLLTYPLWPLSSLDPLPFAPLLSTPSSSQPCPDLTDGYLLFIKARSAFAGPRLPLPHPTLPGLPNSLQIGRFDCDDEAARARDVAAIALGASTNPRLNFDADHYTLEAVELMVRAWRAW